MIPNCDQCHQPMKLVKKGRSKRQKGLSHRIRRFHCSLCDLTTTIHADGRRDLVVEPYEASMLANNLNSLQDESNFLRELHKNFSE